jgi:hypothetical protein
LLVRIGACNESDAALRIAGIVGKMGYIGRDVDEVPCLREKMVFQSVAIPHSGFTAQNMDGSFMSFMLVRLRTSAWWNGHDLQVDFLRPHRFRRNSGRIQKVLLTCKFRPCADNSAGPLAVVIGNFRRHVQPISTAAWLASNPQDASKLTMIPGVRRGELLYSRGNLRFLRFEFVIITLDFYVISWHSFSQLY